MSGITTVSLGEGKDGFYDTFPLVAQSTWRDVWAVFPHQSPLQHPALAAKLDAYPQLRAPRYLQANTKAPDVNTFLEVVNDAFPRGPSSSTTTTKVGPTTNNRECPAKDLPALRRQFDNPSDFSTFSTALHNLNGGRPGGLVLVATG
jgi:hypothetical protein